jgi:hypothetical protein
MTHIAIQAQLDGSAVEWMEKVSDEQYQTLSISAFQTRSGTGDHSRELLRDRTRRRSIVTTAAFSHLILSLRWSFGLALTGLAAELRRRFS